MPEPTAAMRGKTVVVTGGTSGIGEIAALRLAEAGARIVLVARDRGRAEATLRKLQASSAGVEHAFHLGDLSHVAEVRRVGEAIAAAEPRIDVLINNAGAMISDLDVTDEGFERTFATNHLSYVVLTAALRDRLLASAPARIVNTASDAHRMAKLDWTDLQSKRDYGGFQAYCRTKLYNVLFTRELARQLDGSGVVANCLHPGLVNSRFGSNATGLGRLGLSIAKSIFGVSPEKGARTIIHLASAPDAADVTGDYWVKQRPARTTAIAADAAAADRLWQATLALLQGRRDEA